MELVFYLAALVTILTGLVALFHWLKNKFTDKKQEDGKSDLNCIGHRFISLFESHGVNRAQIPAFFDHGLTIHQCSTPGILKENLTSEMITDACELFNINLDWLYGASDEIYEVLDFYKNPRKFESFLDKLMKSAKNEIEGFAIRASETTNYNGYDALILYTETIGELNNRPIYRYYFCGKWSIYYWKSRCYYAACCAISLRNKVYLSGRVTSQKWIQNVSEGKRLIEYDYTYFKGEPIIPDSSFWSVDEFVERPSVFIKDIDKEKDNYGIRAALSMWLDLDRDGFMKVWDDGSHASVVESFKNYLDDISSG